MAFAKARQFPNVMKAADLLAYKGKDSVALLSASGRSPRAVISEVVAFHLAGAVDIAQVDEHRRLHGQPEELEIERLELTPFRHQHGDVGTVGGLIGPFDERGIQHLPGILHTLWIVARDDGAGVLQRLDAGESRTSSVFGKKVSPKFATFLPHTSLPAAAITLGPMARLRLSLIHRRLGHSVLQRGNRHGAAEVERAPLLRAI